VKVLKVIPVMPQKKPGDPGLWDNIHAKRERIEKGSGETMRKPGSKGAPTDKALKDSQSKKK
jgi:hypothetical protein